MIKVIFETEDEKREFMDKYCPSNFGLEEPSGCSPSTPGCCNKCWERSGVILAVSGIEKSLSSIEESLSSMNTYLAEMVELLKITNDRLSGAIKEENN